MGTDLRTRTNSKSIPLPIRQFVVMALLALILAGSLARAEEVSSVEQKVDTRESGSVCVGYDPVRKKWGWSQYLGKLWIKCPPHYAFYGTGNPVGPTSGGNVQIIGNCCPLPAKDILTREHVIVDVMCPEDFVVTGVCMDCISEERCAEGRGRPMRCTRINQKKYALGPVQKGVHWGEDTASAFPWLERKFLRSDEIPTAVRYGISRVSRNEFSQAGCVGDPVGSLLTGKHGSTCKENYWRELLRREKTGDGERLIPVEMFPQCKRISDPFSPEAECLK